MQKTHFISVILPLKLEWEPCYSSDCRIKIGNRVRVLFAGKEYVAVVSSTDIVPDISPDKIKPVLSHETGLGDILPQEIILWRKVAEYYMCSVGEVYKAAYPSGKISLEEARAATIEKALKRRDRIILSINAKVARLQQRLHDKEEAAAKAKEGTKARCKVLEDMGRIRAELDLTSETLEAAIAERDAIRKGLTGNMGSGTAESPELSESQFKAYEQIHEGFLKGRPVLLHGVTGSGKTEIYISLAQETIRKGKNVLYLVPEIALSRQLEDRLYKHFGENLLTFHSGESGASRRNTEELLRQAAGSDSDKCHIVLGTRSSLFLPHHNLGLIIVDEEHDSSYKQDSPAPRYNGRDTALMLYQIENAGGGECSIILGSATPSLEELYNCSTGRHIRVVLSERYHGSEDAEIEIIDTKAERRKNGMVGSFSRKLIRHINRTLDNNGQILILRSRRAWSIAMQCSVCGSIQKCPHCNVSLSYHRNTDRMRCHYCGYSRQYIDECVSCKGQLTALGAGTQKIEEELADLFPHARIARLDSDTARDKSHETRIIRDFAKGKTDILVGTQIIAKGFDFSNLSLVAVLSADALLGIQDFRADEKAFHLFEQFRGRCGRRERQGYFVIQTSQPEHPIYRRLHDNDTDSFNIQLLQERKDFNFPPYSRIIEITVKDTYKDRCEMMADMLAGTMSRHLPNLTGPYAPVVDKIADNHIRKLRISLPKDRNLSTRKALLKDIIERFCKDRKYEGHIVIDVDPA